ncbi:ATP-binding protein [Bacillus tianshenii]|nr:ATP-binding protein [Bacillus tianshenii]
MISRLTGVKSSKKNYYTELKTSIEQLKKKNLQLEIMNEVMKSIKVDMSIDAILENVALKLKAIINFDRLSLSLLNNDHLSLTYVYPDTSKILEKGTNIPCENSIYWSVVKEKKRKAQSLTDSSYASFEKELLLQLNIKNVLVLPVYIKSKVIGVISFGRKKDEVWESSDQLFLEQLADHLAVSIDNSRLYNQVLQGKKEWEDTFKAVDDLIMIFDTDMNVLQYNHALNNFFEWHQSNSVIDFHSSLGVECLNLVKKTIGSRKQTYEEVQFDKNRTCEMYAYPVHNDEMEMYAVIVNMKDVTEKRKMEVQLLHSGKLAAIGEMAAGVAHELNSPLTAILGNSQLLMRSTPKEEHSYIMLQDIKNCGDRCKNIIKSLLTFSRQDDYSFDHCSLNHAVDQVLNLVKFQIERNQIKVMASLDESLPTFYGNQPQIEQVIINLLINARDAFESFETTDKMIEISTYQDEKAIFLSIRDNGMGIEKERLNEIFHPFHTTKGSNKGTGLGLSVSLGIARAHGGTIEVSSEVGKGSLFVLRIPLK